MRKTCWSLAAIQVSARDREQERERMVERIDGDIHKYIKKNTREILQNLNVIYSYYNIYCDIYCI